MALFLVRWEGVRRTRRLLFSTFSTSSDGAIEQKPYRQHYRQDCQDSRQTPSEHTGVFFIAVIKYKLPKLGHLGFGHVFCKHSLCSGGASGTSITPRPVYLTASKTLVNNTVPQRQSVVEGTEHRKFSRCVTERDLRGSR